MRIVCIGGGPASLYFAILMKKAFPPVDIEIYERNRADDTFGWGVVFSEETLGHFRDADAELYDAITDAFARWDDIDTWYRDTLRQEHGARILRTRPQDDARDPPRALPEARRRPPLRDGRRLTSRPSTARTCSSVPTA